MITLYGFGHVFERVIGDTRDLRVHRALGLYAGRLGVTVADIR